MNENLDSSAVADYDQKMNSVESENLKVRSSIENPTDVSLDSALDKQELGSKVKSKNKLVNALGAMGSNMMSQTFNFENKTDKKLSKKRSDQTSSNQVKTTMGSYKIAPKHRTIESDSKEVSHYLYPVHHKLRSILAPS